MASSRSVSIGFSAASISVFFYSLAYLVPGFFRGDAGNDDEQAWVAFRLGFGLKRDGLLLVEHQLLVQRAGLAEDGLRQRDQGRRIRIGRVERRHVVAKQQGRQGLGGPG